MSAHRSAQDSAEKNATTGSWGVRGYRGGDVDILYHMARRGRVLPPPSGFESTRVLFCGGWPRNLGRKQSTIPCSALLPLIFMARLYQLVQVQPATKTKQEAAGAARKNKTGAKAPLALSNPDRVLVTKGVVEADGQSNDGDHVGEAVAHHLCMYNAIPRATDDGSEG